MHLTVQTSCFKTTSWPKQKRQGQVLKPTLSLLHNDKASNFNCFDFWFWFELVCGTFPSSYHHYYQHTD